MPAVTLLYASILGAVMTVIGVRVSLRRRSKLVSLGDGGDKDLLARTRAFGNLIEYVPMILLLMGFAEMCVRTRRFCMASALCRFLAG